MRILVTGGAGFIGSHLVDKLREEEHSVLATDDLSGGTYDGDIYQADCRDAEAMEHVMATFKPEILFHLAANAAESKAQFAPIDVTSRNYDCFVKTLTPFIRHGGRRCVFVSSIAVYGALQTPFRETDRPEPEDLYGISKYAAEESLKVLSRVHGLEYVIVRPHNVFGPRQNMRDPYRNVVTIFMNALLRNEPVALYGQGEPVRQFTYIDDLIYQLSQCATADVAGETFNLGSDAPILLKTLLNKIQNVSGITVPVEEFPLRPQEVLFAIADHSKARQAFGEHITDLDTALLNTWEWVTKQGPQQPIYTELELPSDKVPTPWQK